MARPRRPHPEGLPTRLGRDVSVGAACRADRPLRGGVRRDRQGSGRDRRRPRGVVGAVLQTHRAGRRRVPGGAGRVLDPRGPGPDPERTRRARPAGRRRHPRPQVRPRRRATCARHWLAEAAAVGVTPTRCEPSIAAAARHAPAVEPAAIEDGGGRVDGAAVGVASPRRAPSRVRHDPPATRRRRSRLGGGVGTRRRRRARRRASISTRTTAHAAPVSDGRSVWIEPSARHHTSPEILVQEETIVSWAIDAQLDPADVRPGAGERAGCDATSKRPRWSPARTGWS